MISSKLLIDTKARGCIDTEDEKNFNKAMYQSIVMFFGMAICLPIYFVSKLMGFQKTKEERTNETLSEEEKKSNKRKIILNYFLIIVPASFDLIASTMMTFGLFFITVSITQMLRGSMIIFSAILTVFVRKKKMLSYQWLGVLLCSLAVVIVGLSSILGNKSNNNSPVGLKILGILLVLSSQFIQASQVVVEDFLLGDLKAPVLVVVGMEGIWGFLISAVLFIPLFYFIPGSDGSVGITTSNGSMRHLEDVYDTLCMIAHQPLIIYFTLSFWFSIIILNYGGMVVTQETSAVMRTIFEALRTTFVWIVQVFIYYVFRKEQYGEKLNYYSIMEGVGFLLLVFSLFVYNAVVKLRCLRFLDYSTPAEPPPPAVENDAAYTDFGHPPPEPYNTGSEEGVGLQQPLLASNEFDVNQDQESV